MKRVLVLCTHNSARSQMAEAWLRYFALQKGLSIEVFSAGTEKTRVKPEAITVMREVGIDISSHTSKTLYDLSDPWNFDVVMTVCDSANEICPVYPAKTKRLHLSFPDPSGQAIEGWREVRDALKVMAEKLILGIKKNQLAEDELKDF
jgi:arsenate reductase (thioredoxin)